MAHISLLKQMFNRSSNKKFSIRINIHSQTICCYSVITIHISFISWRSFLLLQLWELPSLFYLTVLVEGLVIMSMEFIVELHFSGRWLSGLAWPFSKCVENSIILTCFEITGYRIKYSTTLWLLELQIRRCRKV